MNKPAWGGENQTEKTNNVLQPHNPGYSDWAGIYSDLPSYVPQCDFSYMIGPDMFDTFVKPELAGMIQVKRGAPIGRFRY